MSKKVEKVKAQYEALPYPPRDPKDEKKGLRRTVDNIHAINHYGFKGKINLNSDFNILVAGGGTGDSAIYLAEQVKKYDAKVTYIDMSSASRKIAEARAKIRKLNNIEFITGSLLDVGKLTNAKFDYINCSGVLHHLPDPEHGLQALESVMKDYGLMFLMLYAAYGRDQVYQLQMLLSELFDDTMSMDKKISLTRKLIDTFDDQGCFKGFKTKWHFEMSHDNFGDSGLYDLLLHAIDRCYTVDELYDFANSASLHIQSFIGHKKAFYNPKYLNLNAFLPIDEYSSVKQHDFSERIYYGHFKHQFFLNKGHDNQASIDDESLSVLMSNEMSGKHLELANSIVPGQPFKFNYQFGDEKGAVVFPMNERHKMICALFDGKLPIQEICNKVLHAYPNIAKEDIKQDLADLFDVFHNMNWAYLSAPSLLNEVK